ncbi:MAG: hypothetical protein LBS46_04220 [Dysgonamonadaceae bacterium]|jgi:hypothetical protein|nr:hypothetical protein [Dysgonamonadaceae bacterium]
MESQEKTKKKKRRKGCFISTGVILLALTVFLYVRFYFVFGEGVKAGQLNYVVYKGYLFKTYEGKLIQSGLRSGTINGSIQSNEFVFSVADKAVAEKLMLSGGREVDLHYREYRGALPWRGYSKYVVDSIINIQ